MKGGQQTLFYIIPTVGRIVREGEKGGNPGNVVWYIGRRAQNRPR